MAKMRFTPNDEIGAFEWEGTTQEVLEIYDEIRKREQNNTSEANSKISIPSSVSYPTHIRLHIGKVSDEQELLKKMPTLEQLMFYILGKEKFEHDIVEIEKKFFDKQINSRKYGKLYRILKARLELARKSIEESKSGAFERKPTRHRNLPYYTFKKVNATPIDASLQRTS